MDQEKDRITEDNSIKTMGEQVKDAPALAELSDGNTVAAASDWDDTTAADAIAVSDMEKGGTGAGDGDKKATDMWDWDADPENPYNWTKRKRWAQIGMGASFAIVA